MCNSPETVAVDMKWVWEKWGEEKKGVRSQNTTRLEKPPTAFNCH